MIISFYIAAFLVTALWSDFVNYILFSFGPLNIYPIDLLMACALLFLVRKRRFRRIFAKHSVMAPWFPLLGWILVSIIRGIPSYSFSALGDSRIILPMFLSLVSYVVIAEARDLSTVLNMIERVLLSSALAVIVMFVVELVVGHRVGFFQSV